MAAEQNNDAERATPALKPCPFCGVHLKGEIDDGCSFHTHPKNECFFSEWEFDALNVEQWNRRSAAIGEGGLPELPDVLNRYTNVGLAGYTADQMRQFAHDAVAAYKRKHAAIQEMVDIAQANDMGYGSPQAAQGVKTWQERVSEDHSLVIRVAMEQEIDDLRAQLARQSQGEPSAWKYRALAGNGEWRVTLNEDWARSVNGDVDVVPLYAAPPLSSEQQGEQGEKA
jgi:hypothetical protein